LTSKADPKDIPLATERDDESAAQPREAHDARSHRPKKVDGIVAGRADGEKRKRRLCASSPLKLDLSIVAGVIAPITTWPMVVSAAAPAASRFWPESRAIRGSRAAIQRHERSLSLHLIDDDVAVAVNVEQHHSRLMHSPIKRENSARFLIGF
jgi:hypothetical protein